MSSNLSVLQFGHAGSIPFLCTSASTLKRVQLPPWGQQACRYESQKSSRLAAKGEEDLLSNITEELRDDEKEKESPGKGFGTPQAKPKSRRKSAEKPFSVQSALDQPPTASDQVEANIVRALGLLFIIFFCEGIFLAIAGFLPEAADNFAVNYVYPAFSPTLGIFLLISVVYGLLKTRQGES